MQSLVEWQLDTQICSPGSGTTQLPPAGQLVSVLQLALQYPPGTFVKQVNPPLHSLSEVHASPSELVTPPVVLPASLL
jgi:hypothetical protein